MAGINDPALLQFAGQLLSGGRQGQIGFGSSLGGALMGAAQSRNYQLEQARQNEQDLMSKAQTSVNLRAALGELQQQEAAQAAQQSFIEGLPPEQQAAAGVVPQGAAQRAFDLANPQPITPVQQAGLDIEREKLDLARQETAGRLQEMQVKIAAAGAPDMKDIAGLRKEYSGLSKPFIDVRDGYKRVLSAQPGPAGDQAMIFSFMKMLDPTSVVREGEQATVKNSAGIPERVRRAYNNAIRGDALTEAMRADFTSQATKLYQEQFETQAQQAQGFVNIAQRFGMNPADILESVPMPEPLTVVNEATATNLGADWADIEAAAAEAGVSPEVIIQALDAKRGSP